MNWCKLIGHKWQYYFDDVPHTAPSISYSHTFKFMIETEFRFCANCFTNQIRVAHSGYEQVDWCNCQLKVEQLRDKKLKDLGI